MMGISPQFSLGLKYSIVVVVLALSLLDLTNAEETHEESDFISRTRDLMSKMEEDHKNYLKVMNSGNVLAIPDLSQYKPQDDIPDIPNWFTHGQKKIEKINFQTMQEGYDDEVKKMMEEHERNRKIIENYSKGSDHSFDNNMTESRSSSFMSVLFFLVIAIVVSFLVIAICMCKKMACDKNGRTITGPGQVIYRPTTAMTMDGSSPYPTQVVTFMGPQGQGPMNEFQPNPYYPNQPQQSGFIPMTGNQYAPVHSADPSFQQPPPYPSLFPSAPGYQSEDITKSNKIPGPC